MSQPERKWKEWWVDHRPPIYEIVGPETEGSTFVIERAAYDELKAEVERLKNDREHLLTDWETERKELETKLQQAEADKEQAIKETIKLRDDWRDDLAEQLNKERKISAMMREALEKIKKTAFYDQVIMDLCDFHLAREQDMRNGKA